FDKLAAGKTGTTSDYRDSWFVGYTPALLTLTWVGYKGNETTGLSGASGALPIWTNFMKRATANRFYTDFEPTSKIIILPIDRKSRLLHQSSCGNDKYDEYFIEGTEPSEFCK
ncbi:MAG TPA: penicillin-binding protein, partial [bacterium]|nr:penicillin-binding protein [bacterium]